MPQDTSDNVYVPSLVLLLSAAVLVECQYDGCIRKDAPSSRRCIRQFGCIRYWRLPVAVNASKYRLLFPPPPLSLRTYPLQYIECILCLCRLLPVVPVPLELNKDELGGSSRIRTNPLLPSSTRPTPSSAPSLPRLRNTTATSTKDPCER